VAAAVVVLVPLALMPLVRVSAVRAVPVHHRQFPVLRCFIRAAAVAAAKAAAVLAVLVLAALAADQMQMVQMQPQIGAEAAVVLKPEPLTSIERGATAVVVLLS
jgi:hypothetical protein